MAEVKVLVEGCARKIENGWLASSNVTLVKSNNKKIVVDPGCNRKKLLEELSKNKLKTSDINFVLLTHSHTDHIVLTGIFEKARVLNNYEIYNNEEQIEHHNEIPGTDLKIIQTPGHTDDHCSLVVKTRNGIYVVAGDVFWWMDNEEQNIDVNKEDQAHPCDMKKLIESRKLVLQLPIT